MLDASTVQVPKQSLSKQEKALVQQARTSRFRNRSNVGTSLSTTAEAPGGP
jgi:hypothetical protein